MIHIGNISMTLETEILETNDPYHPFTVSVAAPMSALAYFGRVRQTDGGYVAERAEITQGEAGLHIRYVNPEPGLPGEPPRWAAQRLAKLLAEELETDIGCAPR
jgi:hypothetical protein